MKIKKSTSSKAEISTASMPDVIFMLIIFFMVVSVFKKYDGLPVKVPSANETKKIEQGKRDITYIWGDRKNRVMIDDQLVEPKAITDIVRTQLVDNPKQLMALKVDQRCEMGIVSDIQQALREGYALRVVYYTRFK